MKNVFVILEKNINNVMATYQNNIKKDNIMFKGINKVFILGIIISEPEINYTTFNKAIATLIVSTDNSWKDKNNGTLNVRTNLYKITLYGKLAENSVNYIKKNAIVYIEGSLRSNNWKDKDNVLRYNSDIIAINIQVVDVTNNQVVINNNNFSNNQNKNFTKTDIPF